VKTVLVEAKLTVSMAKTQILPAALRYQTELAQGIAAAKAAGLTASTEAAQQVTKLIAELESQLKSLEGTLAHVSESPLEEAKALRDKALPTMTSIRAAADALEGLVATDVWPLPSYQEMLFIR
jgi:glutamine synthetase